jgi:5-hydroxyisourate hydrolase-like protein (transthyretin family)
VNITVSVIDGVSGHPAEGVEVSVVGRPAGEPTRRLHGFTDLDGNFTYSSETPKISDGGCYVVELDVDAYYTSQGIMAGYKRVSIVVRIAGTESDYRVGTFITPFAHATWSLR